MNAKHECPVVLKLVQGRRRCFIPLALKVKWEDWNFKKSLLKEKRGTLEEKIEQQKGNLYLESEVLKIKKILLDFTMMEEDYTLEEVVIISVSDFYWWIRIRLYAKYCRFSGKIREKR